MRIGNRRGKLKIGHELVPTWRLAKALSEIGFLPRHVEMDPETGDFEYLGWSELFDEISPGEETPFYTMHFNMEGQALYVAVNRLDVPPSESKLQSENEALSKQLDEMAAIIRALLSDTSAKQKARQFLAERCLAGGP